MNNMLEIVSELSDENGRIITRISKLEAEIAAITVILNNINDSLNTGN